MVDSPEFHQRADSREKTEQALKVFKTILSEKEITSASEEIISKKIDFPFFEPLCKLLLKVREHANHIGPIDHFVKSLRKYMDAASS